MLSASQTASRLAANATTPQTRARRTSCVFGFFARLATLELAASSVVKQRQLKWHADGLILRSGSVD
jgi:hypothetical protein